MSTRNLHTANIIFFITLSIFLTLGRMGTAFSSFALLNPDLGVYASLAAAQDNPDLFARDPFLSNEKNINSYNMVFVPLVKTLNKVFGNYGTACAFLLPFVIFLHLTGYYLLGVTVFKNPWAGMLVALLISAPISTAYDFWGLLLDVLPRFMYQSLIPFVLVLSIRYGKNPKYWTVILSGVGVLNYIHPLSTPAWAAAIVAGLWVSAPEIPFWKRVRYMSLASIVLLLILSPFVINYFTSTIAETYNSANYEQTVSILQKHVSSMGAENPLAFITTFFFSRTGDRPDVIWYIVWLLGIGGIVLGLVQDTNIYIRQIAAWMLGIFFVGGLVTVVERIIFSHLRQIPPEIELLRTIRYLVPLILLAAVYGLWTITAYFQQDGLFSSKTAWQVFAGVGVLLLLLWGISGQKGSSFEFRKAIKQNLSCWRQGHVVCDLPPFYMDFIDAMDVIREQTPAGARILSEGQEVAIRYYALRPLVFTYKDGAPLAYINREQLLAWSMMYDELDELGFIRRFPFRHKAFVNEMTKLALRVEADYILLQEPYDDNVYYPEQLSIVYSNEYYSLFKVK